MSLDGDSYFRWSDDLRYLATVFADAYRAQEKIERVLYAEGFSLGGGKTYIRRAASAMSRLTNLQASLELIRDERLRKAMSELGPYDEVDPEELGADADQHAAQAFYTEVMDPVQQGQWSKDPLFHTKTRFILRILGALGDPIALHDVERIVFYYPALIAPVSRYLQAIAAREPAAVSPVVELLLKRRNMYLTDYLHLGLAFAAAPLSEAGPAIGLSAEFAGIALDPSRETVLRRRAGLAAVALSPPGSTTASALWSAFDGIPDAELSRLYLVAGASGHPDRDGFYATWSGESRLISAATAYLAGNRLDLAKV
jgi:hypothetical protein